MKKLILFMVALAATQTAGASCNFRLTAASARYLLELEKAGLQKYQSGGACETLDAEFRKCTRTQKAGLSSVFDPREVLGNICMPHLPPPQPR